MVFAKHARASIACALLGLVACSRSSSSASAVTADRPSTSATSAPSAPPSVPSAPVAPSSSGSDAAPAPYPIHISNDGNEVNVSAADAIDWTDGSTFDVPVKSGNDLTLQFVEYASAPEEVWKVASAAKALGAVKEKLVAGWMGPPTIGHLFTWSTKGLAAGSYAIVITRTGEPLSLTFLVQVS